MSTAPTVSRVLAAFVCLALTVSFAAACTKSEATLASEALERGLQAHQAGDLVTAESEYREVLRNDPQNVFAFYNLGVIDQNSNRPFEAENHYRLALSNDADFDLALLNLAILLGDQQRHAETVPIWQRYLTLRPADASSHHRLSVNLRQLGRISEADAELQIAHDLDPSFTLDELGTGGPPAP
jgi:tetratricopeptide (TPR) repeat protein